MTCIAVDSTLAGPFCLPKLASPTSRVRKSSAVGGSLSPRSMVFGSTPPSAPLTKVGLEPRGAALAIATGACISASYALLQDHDLQRTKKTVAGGALGFFGCVRADHPTATSADDLAQIDALLALADAPNFTRGLAGAQDGNPPCWCSFEWSWEMN